MTRNGLFQAFMGTSSRKSENPGLCGEMVSLLQNLPLLLAYKQKPVAFWQGTGMPAV